jgi:hypothetical protein
MSVPGDSYYYDPVYDACEPCLSPTVGGNQCVFTAPYDPRNQDWIIDDDDVYPDDTGMQERCASTNQTYDMLLAQCRDLCPGEGAGGQEYVYAGDTHFGGNCACPQGTMFDPASTKCTAAPPPASLGLKGAIMGVSPGDPFGACDMEKNQYVNCYFPSKDACMSAITGGGQDPQLAAMRRGITGRSQQACPFYLCDGSSGPTVSRNACVCVSSKLGNRIKQAGLIKKTKAKRA